MERLKGHGHEASWESLKGTSSSMASRHSHWSSCEGLLDFAPFCVQRWQTHVSNLDIGHGFLQKRYSQYPREVL